MSFKKTECCEAMNVYTGTNTGSVGCACDLGEVVGEYQGRRLCFVHLARARRNGRVVLQDGTTLNHHADPDAPPWFVSGGGRRG